MAKYPWSQFYYSDFLHDTKLLTNKEVGGWIRILCRMWHEQSGSITLKIDDWASILECENKEADEIIQALHFRYVSDVSRSSNGDVTVTCRRIMREMQKRDKTRKQGRLRQKRYREKKGEPGASRKSNAPCNGDVTEEKSYTINYKSKLDNKILVEKEKNFHQLFWPAYPPRNGRRKKKKEALEQFLKLPQKDMQLVLKGVRNYQTSRDVQKGIGIEDAFRWLRDRRYKEYQIPDEPEEKKLSPTEQHLKEIYEEERNGK